MSIQVKTIKPDKNCKACQAAIRAREMQQLTNNEAIGKIRELAKQMQELKEICEHAIRALENTDCVVAQDTAKALKEELEEVKK